MIFQKEVQNVEDDDENWPDESGCGSAHVASGEPIVEAEVMTPRPWRRALMVAASFWLCLALLAWGGPWADWLVLPPRPTAAPVPPNMRRVIFPWGSGSVELFVREAGKKPVLSVLGFCGQGQQAPQKTWDVLDLLDDVACEFWTVNYPGYGRTTGPSRLSRVGPCALRAYDGVREATKGRPLLISGFSLGGVPALYVAARRSVDGLVVMNPPVLRPIILRHGWWNLWALAFPIAMDVPGELDACANAAQAHAPAVLVSSVYDRIAPFDLAQRVAEGYAGPKSTVIVQGGHNIVFDRALTLQMRDRLRWLVRQVRK